MLGSLAKISTFQLLALAFLSVNMNDIEAIDDIIEIEEANGGNPVVPRVPRVRIDPFDLYSNAEFYQRFRMRKNVVRKLIELIGDDLTTQRLPGSFRVPAALHTLAAGCFQATTGDVLGVSQSTQSATIRCFLDVLLKHRKSFVYFPRDLRHVKTKFRELGMAGVIGAVDGTHVLIKRPRNDPNSDRYFNRKSQISINTQVVAGPDLTFYNVVARWPGSTHDSRVFLNSKVHDRLFHTDLKGKGYLLGDKGYPSLPLFSIVILFFRS